MLLVYHLIWWLFQDSCFQYKFCWNLERGIFALCHEISGFCDIQLIFIFKDNTTYLICIGIFMRAQVKCLDIKNCNNIYKTLIECCFSDVMNSQFLAKAKLFFAFILFPKTDLENRLLKRFWNQYIWVVKVFIVKKSILMFIIPNTSRIRPFLNILVSKFTIACFKSSHTEVFLWKGVLKICCKFTAEDPCRSAISIKLLKGHKYLNKPAAERRFV